MKTEPSFIIVPVLYSVTFLRWEQQKLIEKNGSDKNAYKFKMDDKNADKFKAELD